MQRQAKQQSRADSEQGTASAPPPKKKIQRHQTAAHLCRYSTIDSEVTAGQAAGICRTSCRRYCGDGLVIICHSFRGVFMVFSQCFVAGIHTGIHVFLPRSRPIPPVFWRWDPGPAEIGRWDHDPSRALGYCCPWCLCMSLFVYVVVTSQPRRVALLPVRPPRPHLTDYDIPCSTP